MMPAVSGRKQIPPGGGICFFFSLFFYFFTFLFFLVETLLKSLAFPWQNSTEPAFPAALNILFIILFHFSFHLLSWSLFISWLMKDEEYSNSAVLAVISRPDDLFIYKKMTIASQSYRWNTAPLSFLGNSHFMRFYYLVEFIPREKLLLSLSGFIPERKREQGFNFSVYFFCL